MGNTKNILFIHNVFPAGGAERITLDIAKYFNDRPGLSISVYILARHIGMEQLPPDITPALHIGLLPQEAKSLETRIKELDIRVIIPIGLDIPGIREIADNTGCRLVLANHGQPLWQRHFLYGIRRQASMKTLSGRIAWLLFRKCKYTIFGKARREALRRTLNDYNHADAYIVLCEQYRQELIRELGLDPADNKIVAINNPEYRINDVCLQKKKQILYVGRLSYFDKRVDRLLRIWKLAQDRLPGWELLIIGDGEERDSLEALAARLKLKRFVFKGHQNNVSQYYRDASVLCLVSTTEGWPLCLTEAQANGVIPVAFECSAGVRCILEPSGENGFLVKPFKEKMFADTLVKICSTDEPRLLQIRKSMIRKRSLYDTRSVLGKWKELVDQLTTSQQPDPSHE